mgnify:CR=1 FL=1
MRKRIVYVSDEDLEIVSDMLLRSYWSDTPEDMITKGLLTQISNMSRADVYHVPEKDRDRIRREDEERQAANG